MSDTGAVTPEQLSAAYFSLGLSEPDFANTVSVHMDSRWVTVVRYLLNESGNRYIAGDEGPATETAKIPVRWPEET